MDLNPVVQLAEIPAYLYWLIGVSVVANLGTIGSILYFGGRVIWWASSIDHRVKYNEDEIEKINLVLRREH